MRRDRESGEARRSLGSDFGWLWTAYAVSAYGTGLGFGAFAIIAIRVLHAGAAQVSILAASGVGVGALVAVPLGPWVEFRRKRPVMVAMDVIRFAALLSIPVAYVLGWLSFLQLVVVSVIVGAAKNAFRAASGAYLKRLVAREDLLVANGRFESTTWSATACSRRGRCRAAPRSRCSPRCGGCWPPSPAHVPESESPGRCCWPLRCCSRGQAGSRRPRISATQGLALSDVRSRRSAARAA